MGLNFPASPTLNQKYPQPAIAGIPVYTWDGEKWTTVGGSIAAYAPPADAVPLMNAGIGLIGTSTDYAREDHVHPSDTSLMAYSGMQINGGFEVNQQYGAIVQAAWLNYSGYFSDGWIAGTTQATAGSTAFSVGVIGSNLSGIPLCSQIIATGAANFAGATDMAVLVQNIEGYRWARLGFGLASAQSVTISFWIFAVKTGTAHILVGGQGTQARYHLKSFTVNASNTWEYKTLTFPPDVTGPANWLQTNGVGASIAFCFGGGSTTKAGVLDTWANWTTQYASASQTNFFAANNDAVYITGVTVLPGTQAPTAAQSPNIMRPYDQELVTCERYLQYMRFGTIGFYAAGAGLTNYYSLSFRTYMRTNPTIIPSSTPTTSNATVSAASASIIEMRIDVTSLAAGGAFGQNGSYFMDARL